VRLMEELLEREGELSTLLKLLDGRKTLASGKATARKGGSLTVRLIRWARLA
jgi:hypothetical protein